MGRTRSRSDQSSPPALSFGAYLAELLDQKERSPRALAQALDVDVSLVYKWLRDTRIPRLNSGYAEHIADTLELSPVERTRLNASQTLSLRERRVPAPRGASLHLPVEPLLSREPPSPDASIQQGVGLAEAPERYPVSFMRQGAVCGEVEVMEAAIELLESLDAPPNPEATTILLTSQGDGSFADRTFVDRHPRLHDRWLRALCDVTGRGWSILHIWRLTRDLRRSVGIVVSMLDLLSTGAYVPLYLGRYETLRPPYDLLIVPGVAALLSFATRGALTVDSALLIREPEQIAVLRDHHEQLRRQAKPVLTCFLRQDAAKFNSLLVDSEARLPGRLFVKFGLSLFTEPLSWSNPESHWAQRMAYRSDDLPSFLTARTARLEAFYANVLARPYRDICPMQAVEQLALHGRYLRYAEQASEQARQGANPEERHEHLRNAIDVLRAYDHYELALADHEDAAALALTPQTFWEVLGDTRVLLNTWARGRDGHTVDINLAIDEPTLVAGFRAHFDQLWECIKPRNRDKDYVIWWLEQQLKIIP
jgi:hypothetical protein